MKPSHSKPRRVHMTYPEAIAACQAGKQVRRAEWPAGIHMVGLNDFYRLWPRRQLGRAWITCHDYLWTDQVMHLRRAGDGADTALHFQVVTIDDRSATDWEIYLQ